MDENETDRAHGKVWSAIVDRPPLRQEPVVLRNNLIGARFGRSGSSREFREGSIDLDLELERRRFPLAELRGELGRRTVPDRSPERRSALPSRDADGVSRSREMLEDALRGLFEPVLVM